jgi:hypothetical protein
MGDDPPKPPGTYLSQSLPKRDKMSETNFNCEVRVYVLLQMRGAKQ